MNIFEKIKFLAKLNQLINQITMKNGKSWKTTVTAIIGIALLAGHTFFPVLITTEVMANATLLLASLGFANAKDNNVTGGTIPQ